MQQLQEPAVTARNDALLLDRITRAVIAHDVMGDYSLWGFVGEKWPGVAYFATDLDPRSFEKVSDEAWRGQADLLLTMPQEIRPRQQATVSFTLPVDVELREVDGEFSVMWMRVRKETQSHSN